MREFTLIEQVELYGTMVIIIALLCAALVKLNTIGLDALRVWFS